MATEEASTVDEWAGLYLRRIEIALAKRNFDLARRIIDQAEEEYNEPDECDLLLPVSALALPIKQLRHLHRHGVRTIDDLRRAAFTQIRGRGFGPAVWAAIRAKLQEFDLRQSDIAD